MATSQISTDCEVCLEDMVEPRSLPCGHTYCRKCLQQLIDAASNIRCPRDRNLYHVPNGDAGNLSRNFYLEELLAKLRTNLSDKHKFTCSEHADKAAKFFCQSCVLPACAKCVLKHNGHNYLEYSESREMCTRRIQQLQIDVNKFKQTVDNEKPAKTSAVEAQVAACKRKVDATVNKIREIVQVLNAAADSLENKTVSCRQLFKLDNLSSLRLEVDELSKAVSSLSDSTYSSKLESQFEQVDRLTLKLKSLQSTLTKEPIADVSRLFSDSQLTRSLQAILNDATALKQNLANDTKDFLSLGQLREAIQQMKQQTTPAQSGNANMPSIKELRHQLVITGGYGNSSTYAYDTTCNTWRQLASLSTNCEGAAATLCNGKMVVAGGWNMKMKFLDTVEQYEPETNSWTALPKMQHKRQRLGLVCFGNSLFAIGGGNNDYLNSVEQYSLDEKEWKNIASLNVERSGLTCVVIANGILAAGGDIGPRWLNSCELFDGATQTWKYVASLQTARSRASAATLNDKVYVFGGWSASGNLDSVEVYDCAADNWTLLPVRLSVPRGQLAAATVNGQIYICGGNSNYETIVESFDVSKMRISCVAPLPKGKNGAAAVSVPLGETF